MKVTIDSSEPLADALRVLGALYDVEIVVSTKEPRGAGLAEVPSIATPPETNRTSRSSAAATNKQRNKRRGGAKKVTPPVTNVELRSWARQNGFTVSGRGRLPASVIAAYRAAHEA